MRTILVALLLAACAAAVSATPRVVLFDSPQGTTARALQALQVPCKVAAPGDYGTETIALFDYQVAIWGMDADQAPLDASPEPVRGFLNAGGVVLVMRMAGEPTWLGEPVKMDKAYTLGEVLKPDHALFASPYRLGKDALNKVHGGSIYRAFYDLPSLARPLVGTGAEQTWDKNTAASTGAHFGLVELPFGKGRVILCQMIPDYGFINDDKGQRGPSSQMLENLVAYVSSVAPNWPAPKPRVVPASFHRELSDLLREPTPQGTLPMADTAWQISTHGAFTCQPDRRGVLTMSHADAPAAAGDFAQMSRTVRVSDGVTGRVGVLPASGPSSPVFLRFYNSDDYCGGTEPKMVGDARVSSHENRIKGVRFKQVLVNGKAVWEEDALGLNPVPASRRFHLVDISDCLGKDGAATVTLRVEDRAPTADDQPFATDVYWAGLDVLPGIVMAPLNAKQPAAQVTFSGAPGKYAVLVHALDEPVGRAKVQVSVDGKPFGSAQLTADDYSWYWIDLGTKDLKSGSAVTVQATADGGEVGSVDRLAFIPASLLAVPGSAGIPARLSPSSPLYKPTPPVTRATFDVLVSGPEAYKPQGEVVSGGMPFAYGAVKSEQNLRLLNDQNKEVPLQTRVLAKWPDGSLKWVLFTFPTEPGLVRCEYGTQVKREADKGLTVTQDDKTISINTGPLQVTISKTNGDLCETLALDGKPLKAAATFWPLVLDADGKKYSSLGDTVTRCQIVEAGPERAIVRRIGRLRAEDGSTLLEYDLTQEFTLNSGVMRVQPVLTHKEASAEQKLGGVFLSVNTPWLKPQEATVWKGDQEIGVQGGLGQENDQRGVFGGKSKDGAMFDGMVKRDPGYFRLAGQGTSVDLIPRWFWQMYPGSVGASSGGLALGWASSLALHQGEAIWNDFALRFSDDTGKPVKEDFNALANPPVALAEPEYTASTLALCQFMPENKAIFPEYEDTVESQYKAMVAKRDARHEYGIANFGDDTFEWGYGPVYTFWSNQEYDHHYGMLLQFLRSGDWRWWEAGDAGTRHHVNEDCIHWAPGHEQDLGSPHHHNSRHLVDTGWVADHTVAGSDVTHAWVEGQIAYYFMTGDQRTLENWQAMGDWWVWCVSCNRFGAGGQERGPGWTLVALSALYNATNDKKYLDAGNKVMDWLRGIQDPVRGVISIPISEQPSYEGGSAFMHGIVARGAGRWYEATGDPRGKLAALGIADWLTSEAMGPPSLFYYKQAPRIKGTYSISEWQCISALTYGMKYGDEAWYGPLAEAHYLSGRASERSMAWVPQSLAQLEPRFWPYRAKCSATRVMVAPGTPAELKLQFANASPEPVSIALKMKSAPVGVAVSIGQSTVALPARGTAEGAVTVTVKQLPTASGTLQLELLCSGKTRLLEWPVVAVPVLVKIGKTAAEGQLQAPFVLDKDKAALAPRDASFTGNPHQPGERAGWVAWALEVPVAGAYLFGADCQWLDDKGNSLYLQVDEGPEITFGNDGDFAHWHTVSASEPLKLSAGKHTIRLINREEGGKVRGMTLSSSN